jgi:hypothetical protein
MVTRRRALGALVLGLALSACELDPDKITIPQVRPVVVVHGVINVTEPRQFVILEESLSGQSSQYFSVGLVPPAPAAEGIPIEGAFVTLTYHGTGPCAQPTVTLHELPPVALPRVGTVPSGTYATSELCALSPGDTVDLRVETPSGDVVLGRTVIPGAQSVDIRTRGASGPNITFDRTSDSIWVAVDPISARALAFELCPDPLRSPYGNDYFHYTLAADTMSMVFAGDLRSFESEDDGEAVFMPGLYLTLTVGVADTNYYDFVRSFSNPLNGRGFINHVQGGVGVFGSVFTSERSLRVIDRQDDEREGLYRISGTIEGVGVNVILDVYLEPFRRHGEFSAFVDGAWVGGPLSTSADGRYEYTTAAGSAGRGDFEATLATVSGNRAVRYVISGSPTRVTESFQALVTSVVEIEPYYYMTDELGSVTVERVARGGQSPG